MQQHLPPIAAPLTEWFESHQRDLPWRRERTPYHVWISEIMLQQTRIEAVKRYYTRFMQALPDVESLSMVEEEHLLKLWEGLGYYSRARNLKKAAQIILREYGGRFPDTFAELQRLPGVGAYTAGAIASLCFGEKVPAVDGNVLRVLSRVLGSHENVLLPATKRKMTALLTEHMPDNPGAFNEALMELGETVCLPNGTPDCQRCPIAQHCIAYREHLTAELPVRVKKQQRRREDKTVLVLLTPDGKTAIQKRIQKGLLHGMYQFPQVDGFYSEEALREVLCQWQLTAVEIGAVKESKHAFTHLDWYMQGRLVQVTQEGGSFLWVSPDELAQTYPLPTAFRPFVALLAEQA